MITDAQRACIANLGIIDYSVKEMERLMIDCVPAEAAARIRPRLEEIRALVQRVAAEFSPPGM